MSRIDNARIAIFASDGFEQVELTTPQDELKAAGAAVTVASPDGKNIKGWYFDKWGDETIADARIEDIDPAEFDALVLPGGQINPDQMRAIPEVVDKIRAFAKTGKPVAAICHAPWLLIEAGLVEGKRLTSFKSIRTDLKNAGADAVDEQVAIDGNLITSRNPDDLTAFVEAIVDAVSTARQNEKAA